MIQLADHAARRPIQNRLLGLNACEPDAGYPLANISRLKLILNLFEIPVVAVAKVAKVSGCYISRILSEKDHFQGSPEFWMRLDAGLADLVAKRRGRIFETPITSSEGLETLIRYSRVSNHS